jgi:oligopeptide transport system substrate-binding protein
MGSPPKSIPYNPDEARRLLAEAGFPEGKNFPRLELLYNTHEGHKAIAEAVQQMWRQQLGIDVALINQESKVWTDSLSRHDYQIARYAWIGDYVDPSTFLDVFTTGNGYNVSAWSNAEYDGLILAARNTTDPAARHALFQRCEEILAAELPFAPVYFYNRNRLIHTSVKNFHGNLLDNIMLKGVYLAP